MTEVRGEGDGGHDASDGGGGSRASPSLVSLSTKIMLLVIYLNEFIYFLKHTWVLTRQRSEVRVMAVMMQVMVVVAAGRRRG